MPATASRPLSMLALASRVQGRVTDMTRLDRNLLFPSSMMPSLVMAAPVPISRKMIRICCRRIAIDMAAPYTVSTIPAPVVVRRSWSMATWPLTMHQSRPVAFWAGFVKVA